MPWQMASLSRRMAHPVPPRSRSAFTVAFAVDGGQGQPAPNDDEIESAAFFPLHEALAELQQLTKDVQRDPIAEYLTGAAAPGTTWIYRTSNGTESLLGR
jgi:8-oxo-dGTP diphosphatase